jgi:hypothetical protein
VWEENGDQHSRNGLDIDSHSRELKHWLEQRAAQTLASRNSEIVRCIRHEMDAERQERVSG